MEIIGIKSNLARFFLLIIFNLLVLALPDHKTSAEEFDGTVVRLGRMADAVEKNVARLLVERLMESGMKHVHLDSESSAREVGSDELLILPGIPAHHETITGLFRECRIPDLTELAPGCEGFLLKLFAEKKPPLLLAAGVDDRGCLYAAGELLRQATLAQGKLILPDNLEVRTAPAFEIRGTQYGQSYVAKNLAHVRDWTEKETQRVILDYALAGANIFCTEPGPMFDFIKSFGLMTQGGFGANTAGSEVPAEWKAFESIGRAGYVCLSVPEAREFMLHKCEEYFNSSPGYDLIKFHGGDGGGCE